MKYIDQAKKEKGINAYRRKSAVFKKYGFPEEFYENLGNDLEFKTNYKVIDSKIERVFEIDKMPEFNFETKKILVGQLLGKSEIRLDEFVSNDDNKITSKTKISKMFDATRDFKMTYKKISPAMADQYDRVKDLVIAVYGDVSYNEFKKGKNKANPVDKLVAVLNRVPKKIGQYLPISYSQWISLTARKAGQEKVDADGKVMKDSKGKAIILTEDENLSITTINKTLKTLRSVFIYITQEIDDSFVAPKITLIEDDEAVDEKRLPFKEKDLFEFMNRDDEIGLASRVYYFTGLRREELNKCVILTTDADKNGDVIKYISLKKIDTKKSVKTQSSQRFIPLLDEVADDVIKLKEYLGGAKTRSIKMSKKFTKMLREKGYDKKYVLYSCRHNFASKLKNSDIPTTMVNELMGHTHEDMTNKVYASSFELKKLKKALQKLKIED